MAQSIPGVDIPAVPGLQFTATMNLQWTHRVNGTLSTGHIVSTIARDSQGRIHGEGHDFSVGNPDPKATLTSMTYTDPVAGTRTTCETHLRVCHIYPFPPRTPAQIADPFGLDTVARLGPHSRTTPDGKKIIMTEPLAMQTMQGLPVTGVRSTWTPTESDGKAIEDQAGQSVIDTWFSRDREMIVAQLRNFPLGEIQAVEISAINEGDPDPALFTLPAGYEMKDERKAGAVLPEGVTPPVLIRRVDPQFSDEARQHRPLDLSVLVGLVVDAQGVPQKVFVVRGVGEGLDEKAIEAIKQYRFKPAMMDGKPVATALNITVRFQIF
jgi:TonB family protein